MIEAQREIKHHPRISTLVRRGIQLGRERLGNILREPHAFTLDTFKGNEHQLKPARIEIRSLASEYMSDFKFYKHNAKEREATVEDFEDQVLNPLGRTIDGLVDLTPATKFKRWYAATAAYDMLDLVPRGNNHIQELDQSIRRILIASAVDQSGYWIGRVANQVSKSTNREERAALLQRYIDSPSALVQEMQNEDRPHEAA